MLQQNFRPIALKVLNTLTSAYDIQVKDLAVSFDTINKLNFKFISLEYEDSVISLHNAELRLVDGYSALKNMALTIEDFEAVTVERIDVNLGYSFLKRRFVDKDNQATTDADVGLSINHLPLIELAKINIYWADDKDLTQPLIEAHNLSLAASGQNQNIAVIQATNKTSAATSFATSTSTSASASASTILTGKLLLMQQEFIDIALSLNPREWQLNTDVDINKVIQSLQLLDQSVTQRITATSNTDEQQGLQILSQALAPVITPISATNYQFNGHWLGQTRLDLPSGSISSHHEIRNIEIAPTTENNFNSSISFKPEMPIRLEVNYQPQDPHNANQQLSVSLAPFRWQQSTSPKALIKLSGDLNDTQGNPADSVAKVNQKVEDSQTLDKNQSAHNIQSLLTQVAQLSAETNTSLPEADANIDWSLAFDSPTYIDVTLANDSPNSNSHYDLHTASINAQIAHPLLTTQLMFTDNSAAITNENYQVNSAISVDINQVKAIDLGRLDTVDSALIIDGASLTGQLAVEHQVSHNQATTTVSLKQNAQLQLSDLSLKSANKLIAFEGLNWQQQGASELSSTIDGSQIKFNDFSFGFDKFHLKDVSTATDSINAKESLEIHLGQFTVEAKQAIELFVPATLLADELTPTGLSSNIKQPKNKTSDSSATDYLATNNKSQPSLLTSLLNQRNSSDLIWQLNDIRIDKLIPTKSKLRRYPLLRLDSLILEQNLQLHSQLLTGKELWQLDELALSSYHLLQLPKHNRPLSLAGQWQTDSDLAPLLEVLAQTQMLPSDLSIAGHNKLDAGFALVESQGVSLFEMKFTQSLSDVEAQYNEMFFESGSINAQCQFNWQQAHSTQLLTKTYSQSRLLCQDTEVNIANAYVGINLDELNLNADISLGKNEQIAAKNWLQEITGLSDTDVNLTARGNLLDGEFLIPEFFLKLHDKSEGYLMLNGISLQTLLAAQPQVGVYADGIFDGVLPATLVDGKINIAGGHLAARAPGGLIKVSNNPALEQVKASQPHLEIVAQALEHLQYSELISTLDMEQNGDAQLAVQVKGQSKDIERPIHLNYSHEENLFQLYKSTQIGNQLQNDIERSVK
ncbi:YdbH domain-containing protein [Shewanella sp. UCD-KL21]|uniref:YdbH domain-containing protein n=1 Tax=Shewanella sp. UCD-KL21 TaxID=1917164 RepID=UPI001588BE4D|nr:YdbH domain-containing protein [Shewanella sp. UCD-KL21]